MKLDLDLHKKRRIETGTLLLLFACALTVGSGVTYWAANFFWVLVGFWTVIIIYLVGSRVITYKGGL